MAFTSKLNTLADMEGPGRVPPTDLMDSEVHKILGAQNHVHAIFGLSVI